MRAVRASCAVGAVFVVLLLAVAAYLRGAHAPWSPTMTARTILSGAWAANGAAAGEPDGWRQFVREGIRGFRAPYLSVPDSLFAAEQREGFLYDASTVTRGRLLAWT